jgi:hypothetical protein
VSAAGAVAACGPTLRSRLAERGVDRTLLHLAPVLLVLGLLFVYPSSTGSSYHSGPRRGAARSRTTARSSRTPTSTTRSSRR